MTDKPARDIIDGWIEKNRLDLWARGTSSAAAATEATEACGIPVSLAQIRRSEVRGPWHGFAVNLHDGDPWLTAAEWAHLATIVRDRWRDLSGKPLMHVARAVRDAGGPYNIQAVKEMCHTMHLPKQGPI